MYLLKADLVMRKEHLISIKFEKFLDFPTNANGEILAKMKTNKNEKIFQFQLGRKTFRISRYS